jgi:hypothetical protein
MLLEFTIRLELVILLDLLTQVANEVSAYVDGK